jgi:hypothetical protein
VLGADLVVGGGVGDGLVDQARIEAELGQQVTGDGGVVGLVAVLVQGPSGPLVPGVEVGHVARRSRAPMRIIDQP